jgi:hypothetical protein
MHNDQYFIFQSELFLQTLLDFRDDCGGFYQYRSLLLAAEYLTVCPACSQGDAIVDRLLKVSYSYFRADKTDWTMYPQVWVRSARAMLKRTDRPRVVDRFETFKTT